ncbi:WD repeat-containing protein [Aureococcus anophagefferens]|nr:WD repeat-containing protein [Aureococcus anophagefferens]
MAEFANPTPTAARGFDYGSTVGEPRVFDAGGVVWDVTTGALVHTLAGHDRDVTGCAFSGDGSVIVTSSGDKTAASGTATGAERKVLAGHTHWVTSCAVTRDGNIAATGAWDSTARLWDCGSGAELARLGESIPEEGEKFVTSVSFAADGATVATGHCENKAELWDVATGAKLGAVAVLGEEGEGYAAWVPCCALADDGASVLAGGQFGELTLWDVKTQTITASITAGHKKRVNGVALAANGKTCAAGSGDCTASVRKLP